MRKKTDNITIRLPEGMKDKIAAVAAQYDITMTEVIIAALRKFLKVYLNVL